MEAELLLADTGDSPSDQGVFVSIVDGGFRRLYAFERQYGPSGILRPGGVPAQRQQQQLQQPAEKYRELHVQKNKQPPVVMCKKDVN